MNRKARIFPLLLLFPLVFAFGGCERAAEGPGDASGDASGPAEAAPPPLVEGIPLPETGTRPLTPEEQKVVVAQLLKARAQQQAEGLGGGRVKVNGAWAYRGYSYLSPNPDAAIEARLVAVDITMSGHTPHFDIDDIEIVDGANLMSYGSDPHATPLTLEGKIMPEGRAPAAPPEPSRWLLIYAYPKQSPAFHLYYWGKALTNEVVEIQSSGMELPYPSPE